MPDRNIIVLDTEARDKLMDVAGKLSLPYSTFVKLAVEAHERGEWKISSAPTAY